MARRLAAGGIVQPPGAAQGGSRGIVLSAGGGEFTAQVSPARGARILPHRRILVSQRMGPRQRGKRCKPAQSGRTALQAGQPSCQLSVQLETLVTAPYARSQAFVNIYVLQQHLNCSLPVAVM